MRPTRPHETHRSTTVDFAVDAFEALRQLARSTRSNVTTLLRRGAVLALRECGEEIPRSVAWYTNPRLDAVDQMLVFAPPAMTSAEFSRIVLALAERTTVTLDEASRLAAHLGHRAIDFDLDVALLPQLFPDNDGSEHPAAAVPEEPRPALSLVPALPTAPPPQNDRPAWRPVGSPPWGEP